MTFDQCDAVLTEIRRRQGTANPRVRIDLAGGPFTGRVARADSDAEARAKIRGPFGVLVLENPGLGRLPRAVVQIADIPPDGITPAE